MTTSSASVFQKFGEFRRDYNSLPCSGSREHSLYVCNDLRKIRRHIIEVNGEMWKG